MIFANKDEVAAELKCGICHDPWAPDSAKACPTCDTLFCETCLSDHYQKDSKCPACTTEIPDFASLRSAPRPLRSMAERLVIVKCPNRPATCWSGPWGQLASHLKDCQFNPDLVVYAEEVPDELQCAICLNVLDSPMTAPCCEQTFCHKCITALLSKRAECPHCRAALSESVLTQPRQSLYRMINCLKVRCPSQCGWVGEKSHVTAHLTLCTERIFVAAPVVAKAAAPPALPVRGVVEGPLLRAAEEEIKKHTGCSITVKTENVPSNWQTWMWRTGINSICNADTWAFLEYTRWNKPRIERWHERAISTIILLIDTDPDAEDHWIVCEPEWDPGNKTLKLWFNMPRAGSWASDNTWLEPGYKRWWNLSDEIVFGLQLYQLEGKCFYKSDWLEDFEDVDENSIVPNGTKKVARWFQFRHWIIYWYPEAQWGWNWAHTKKPPKLPDGSLFDLNFVLSCPSLPNFTMPQIKLPSLPDTELPSLPSISALCPRSFSEPPPSAPSLPGRLCRPKGKWACHGYIELEGLKVMAYGNNLVLSNAKVTHFWEKNKGIITEEKKYQRLALKATTAEQAESWKLSLMESGVEEGDTGDCCTVA